VHSRSSRLVLLAFFSQEIKGFAKLTGAPENRWRCYLRTPIRRVPY
jgi:hypothetical protein